MSDAVERALGRLCTYLNFYCELVYSFRCLPTVQNVLIRWNVAQLRYPVDFVEEVAD